MRFFFIFLIFIFSFANGISQTMITPEIVTTLNEDIKENSGLANLDGEIWTHNDSGGADRLYQVNIENGEIIRDVKIDNADNEDWEDLASDENYVYIGDFGNNNGDRTDLRVYRISREELANNDEVESETIEFSYSDQTSWEVNHNNHDFDCEAMICYQGHLYLFSKNWVDNQTRMYKLSNQPGTYIAEYQATFDVSCLITGAEILPNSNSLILIGYNTNGGTFTWMFNGFENDDFFEGDNTQFIWTLLTQVEGICIDENNSVFISSENFSSFIDPTLYHFNFDDYITGMVTIDNDKILIYEHHGKVKISSISGEFISGRVTVYNQTGQTVRQFQIHGANRTTVMGNLPRGIYIVTLNSEYYGQIIKKIRL